MLILFECSRLNAGKFFKKIRSPVRIFNIHINTKLEHVFTSTKMRFSSSSNALSFTHTLAEIPKCDLACICIQHLFFSSQYHHQQKCTYLELMMLLFWQPCNSILILLIYISLCSILFECRLKSEYTNSHDLKIVLKSIILLSAVDAIAIFMPTYKMNANWVGCCDVLMLPLLLLHLVIFRKNPHSRIVTGSVNENSIMNPFEFEMDMCEWVFIIKENAESCLLGKLYHMMDIIHFDTLSSLYSLHHDDIDRFYCVTNNKHTHTRHK